MIFFFLTACPTCNESSSACVGLVTFLMALLMALFNLFSIPGKTIEILKCLLRYKEKIITFMN